MRIRSSIRPSAPSTPRYSLYDAIEMGIDPSETGRPATIQERVYSSPIWYNPEG